MPIRDIRGQEILTKMFDSDALPSKARNNSMDFLLRSQSGDIEDRVAAVQNLAVVSRSKLVGSRGLG